MASTSRAGSRLADILLFQTSPSFVCGSCRHQALRRRINLLQQSRYASDKPLPYTEKLRRKIWGTDNPPGLKDPYGGPSFLEKRRMRMEAGERGEHSAQEEESYEQEVGLAQMVEAAQELPSQPEEYVPAETWDGLEHIGHKGHWVDIPPKPEDTYQRWAEATFALRNREDIVKCLGQARAEVLARQEMTLEDRVAPTGPIDLQNPEVFSILKHFMQLSGTRILDPVISKSKTWEVLIDTLATYLGPKPKNIAETLMMRESLVSLPNLKIMGRRETPVDKEKEVGRWKIIESELQSRGLPVLGKVAS